MANMELTTALLDLPLAPFVPMPRTLSADQLERLIEDGILAGTLTRRVIEPVHYFADGLYVREITIPAGTILMGKKHKTAHVNIVSKGDISVCSVGGPVRRIQAPCTLISEPGTQKVAYAHTETVWTTVHATEETDLDKLELLLVEDHVNPLCVARALEEFEEALCLSPS